MQITRKPPQRLSKDFASAAIATLAEMKESKGVLGTMVTFGWAVDGSWAQIYHERVQTGWSKASVAASTNSDHNALQLLSTQFANLAKWESVVVTERQNHNGARTVAPNSLQNDTVLTKFSNCGRFLTAIFGSGIFADNPSCDWPQDYTTFLAFSPSRGNVPLVSQVQLHPANLSKPRNEAKSEDVRSHYLANVSNTKHPARVSCRYHGSYLFETSDLDARRSI